MRGGFSRQNMPNSLKAFQPKHKILIVDDEDCIHDYLSQILKLHGFIIFNAWSGQQAIDLVKKHHPSLVMLDLVLNDGEDGLVTCQRSRALQSGWKMNIIMLTASHEQHFEIAGYNYGADAYLTKPCDPDKILAVINAQLRNLGNMADGNLPSISMQSNAGTPSRDIEKHGFLVCLTTSQVLYKKKRIRNLTPLEFRVLACLLKRAPSPMMTEDFQKEVWGDCPALELHTISTHIHNLKKKLPFPAAKMIHSGPKGCYRIMF